MKKLLFTPVLFLFLFQIASADTTTGLVAHWKFDEGSGAVAGDSAGSYPGNFVNTPVWSTGKIGGGLLFDGTNKYVKVPAAPTVVSPHSISFWFYVNDVSKSQGLLAHGLSAVNDMIFLQGGSIQITSASAGSFRAWCNKTFTSADINRWYHLTVVINSTTDASQWKCYIDGADVGVRNSDSSGTYGNPGNTNWTIGAYYNNSYWLSGAMDDVRIYNRSLSSGDVSELYAFGGGTVTDPPPPPPPDPPPVTPLLQSLLRIPNPALPSPSLHARKVMCRQQ